MDLNSNVERFSGFGEIYDKYRPSPPKVLAEITFKFVGAKRSLLLDLGCGTGLSTRYWQDKVEEVIGIDPNQEMLAVAEKNNRYDNISFMNSFSNSIDLPDNSVDIITCSNSLHWMDPGATFKESERILRPGGVFVAFDNYFPPTTGNWKVESAYSECIRKALEIEETSLKSNVIRLDKNGHLGRMRESGCFIFVKEIMVHNYDSGNEERLTGILLSQGVIQSLLKSGHTEESVGVARFRKIALGGLGQKNRRWFWSSKVRIGIKK